MSALASIVDTDALFEMLWTASVAGLGLTAVFGVAIFGSARALDANRSGRAGETAMFTALGVVAFLVVVAAIVYAIVLMVKPG